MFCKSDLSVSGLVVSNDFCENTELPLPILPPTGPSSNSDKADPTEPWSPALPPQFFFFFFLFEVTDVSVKFGDPSDYDVESVSWIL